MKKSILITVCALIAALCCFSFAACDLFTGEKDVSGNYKLESFTTKDGSTYNVGDSYDGETGIDYTILYRPHYYFLGLTGGAQDKNRDLPQTIGWGDNLKSGAPGTFDPLAESGAAE